MKKLFTVIKIAIPIILMPILVYLMRGGKDILDGLFFVFPLMYVVFGAVCNALWKEWLVGILGISLALLLPINLWFHMGSCVEWALIYTALSLIAFFVRKKISAKKSKKSAQKQTTDLRDTEV